MTHLYTFLVGGTVIAGGAPDAEAIAWAGDTIIALGIERDVRTISRGDSHFVDLHGSCVIPLGEVDAIWPIEATLEVGGPADLAIVDRDPRHVGSTSSGASVRTVAVVRGGRVVSGALPGLHAHEDHSGHT